MKIKGFYFGIFLILMQFLVTNLSYCQIITDGTLGTKTVLSGPHHKITSELGKIMGSNLFHSFSEFNINSGETAIFSGPSDIKNIISRVTGVKESKIDGLLKSEIKGADFYFINPNGIVFGKDAKIDVDGSLYVSTGDYIKFKDSKVYHTRNSEESSLSYAPPQSFGFLKKNTTSNLYIKGSLLIGKESKEINLSSGNIYIENANLFANSGSIIINGVISGEINFDDNQLDKINEYGKITIIDKRSKEEKPFLIDASKLILGNIDASGINGKIRLNSNDIYLNNAIIQLINLGYENSKGIIINANNLFDMKDNAFILIGGFNKGETGGLIINSPLIVMDHSLIRGFNYINRGEDINIKCNELIIKNLANIESSSFGDKDGFNININASDKILIKDNYSGIASKIYSKGNAGDINIQTKQLKLIDKGVIISFSQGDSSGKGANIRINADDITLKNGGIIDNSTFGKASSGEVLINARNLIIIDGKESGVFSLTGNEGNSGVIKISSPILILDNGSTISVTSSDKGDAGSIFIESDIIEIKNEAYIDSTTLGEGKGGNINIKANKSISLNNSLPFGISSISNTKGNSGTIILEAPIILISNSAILLSAYDYANAGNVFIITDSLLIRDNGYIDSSTFGNGKGGSIFISAKELVDISSHNSGIFSMSGKNGNAGTIFIETKDLKLSEGVILTNTNGSGLGGSIHINAKNMTLLNNAIISAESKGSGDAGDIKIRLNKMNLNNSKIRASSDLSLGGNIDINANNIRINKNSYITSTVFTGKGSGGNVSIKAKDLVILNKSSITARADEGKGGNILINSLVFLRDGELKETLNASSNIKGNDGSVKINSPNLDISASLMVLRNTFMNLPDLATSPCIIKENNKSSLIIKGCERIKFLPFDI